MRVCFVIHEILHAQPEFNGANNSPLNVTGQLSQKFHSSVGAHEKPQIILFLYACGAVEAAGWCL